jgi:hypothetical protein
MWRSRFRDTVIAMLKSCLCVFAVAAALAADFPEAQISNGAATAKFYLPDPVKGYYQGTRFDWSGVIHSLRTGKHEYFGVWFDKYDPKLHDAITGPVEEFVSEGNSSVGYDEVQAGGEFIRIGVGAVRKPQEAAYQRFRTYDIVDHGTWKHSVRRDSIEFIHTLGDHNGYAYEYRKTVRLVGDKPEMTIEHALRNTGRKPISTLQYNHNFFVLDGQPVGPDAGVQFAFEPKPKQPIPAEFAEFRGNRLVYLQELPKGKSVFGELTGFGSSAKDFDIRVSNRKTGASVHIQGDRPIEKFIYWSIRTTLCPEPYMQAGSGAGGRDQMDLHVSFRVIGALALFAAAAAGQSWRSAGAKEWIPLFNGKDLSGWTPKITGYEVGENFGNTFRVENGVLKVSYDKYDKFANRFGHLFYKDRFSRYVIAVEYRFVGDQAVEGPGWAWRNSGIMVHGQDAQSMRKDQDFPISIEVQLLGGRETGERTTANLCTPGTNVVMDGKLVTTHCISSKSKTMRGDGWVRVEVEVLGSDSIRHYVNGELVLQYEKPQIGGGNVSNHDAAVKQDGRLLTEGSISLQSESHPVEFRKVELLDLSRR